MAFQNPVPFAYRLLLGEATQPNGVLMCEPQVDLGASFGSAYYQFLVNGSAGGAFEDGALTLAYASGIVTADQYGRFPAIYLSPNPDYIYTVNLYNSTGTLLRSTGPYYPSLSTIGNSGNIGLSVNPMGEYTMTEASSGGTGIELSLQTIGQSACLGLLGSQPGTPLLQINNSATTGAQTATFTATNKPGTATSGPAGWLPIQCDGTLYYMPLWYDNNFQRYVFVGGFAQGQSISAASIGFNGNGATILTGSGAMATPSQWYSPLQAGIGTDYYLAITSFTPEDAQFTGITIPGLVTGTFYEIGTGIEFNSNSSQAITGTYALSLSPTGSPVATTGTFTLEEGVGYQTPDYTGDVSLGLSGNGTTTLDSASVSNWYTPTTAGIGTSTYILINNISGTPGVTFNEAVGTWAEIGTGVSIGLTGSGTVSGQLQVSTSASFAGLVNTGTITLTQGFTPVLHIYTTGTNLTETIPTGANNVVIENWGGGGGGGYYYPTSLGGGGAAAGYCRTSMAVNTQNGKTFVYTTGGAGSGSSTAGLPGTTGGTGTIVAGTVTGFATMTAHGGAGGNYATGASGGIATGGTAANTTGTATGSGLNTGATGTTGTVSGDGSPYGGGGNGALNHAGSSGSPGLSGAAVFYYT
jgi:hypothetical protein